MLDAAKQYLIDLLDNKKYWLTFTGPTEVGKTHLLRRIFRIVRDNDFPITYKLGFPYVKFTSLYKLVSDFLEGKVNHSDIKHCGLLVIEEFLSGTTSTKYNEIMIEKSHEILNERLNKPTLIDTNKSISEIQNIDPRIASRLFRSNGVVVDIPIGTQGYLLRKHASNRK